MYKELLIFMSWQLPFCNLHVSSKLKNDNMRLLILLLFFSQVCYSQINSTKTHFKISGVVVGKDTGKIVLNYNDVNNKGVFDTSRIKNGKFEFSGTVNIISDANLWTDLKNHSFSDKSVVRFLLEANNISISYTDGFATKAIIKGSKTHNEWTKWEDEKSKFIISKSQYKERADSIYKLTKTDTAQLKNLRILINQLDSVSVMTTNADLNYISQHTKSYLSGFLLSRYKRQLSIDSIENYYALLSQDVKKSNVGYTVLNYIYPLSDNIAFKKANPLNGIEFNEKLASIKSIHDLVSSDTLGNSINFKRFKGNYVLIDFWASWCKPCITDIPYLKRIIEEFKNDSIQFISVSLDTDEKKWKKAILDNNLNWLQVSELTGFHGLVPTYCKIIVGIPQYVLVDKNGVIINSDTPRPDDPELKTLLNNSLKK